ncbi:dolichyl-phosphate beta-glucosyltransferase-like isoform X2 [Dendronephthya gigantea]|uniref:dolichyl-phosphate beta-glucosyltransferase-like isoform X2 n=1 Tax=Dendronephthya gigantea TaxID=151771 RepID=UPI00106BF4E4|nr:dolichyl-phosphate beta-glucosyltransferase-like isoform X2 [Dendronephthya gigantea]
MDFFLSLFCAFVLLVVLGILVVVVFIYATTSDTFATIKRYPDEEYFIDPSKENAKIPFPYLERESSVELSVIVPSYNEEERLPVMLDEAFEYLEERKKHEPSFTYEIIIVDDGSKDRTTQVALKYVRKYGVELIRVLTLTKNRGKGGAVRLGMFSSRGKQLLMVDADGATKFSDLTKVQNALQKIECDPAISVGSRAHLQDEAVAQRTLLRNLLMYGFHFLVWFLCVRGIRDTQCGFKLFTRPAALLTFTSLHVERWAFDVELLYIAQRLNIPITEVAVNWQEIDGSKMVPIWSWLQMGKDLLLIRLRYILGVWKISSTNN